MSQLSNILKTIQAYTEERDRKRLNIGNNYGENVEPSSADCAVVCPIFYFRFVIKSDYFLANYSPRTSLESSPDPDLASIEGEILSAGRLDGNGFDRGGIRTAGWFSQAEGGYVLAWSNTHTESLSKQKFTTKITKLFFHTKLDFSSTVCPSNTLAFLAFNNKQTERLQSSTELQFTSKSRC